MISYIKGELAEVGENTIVIENHGIGYLVHISGSVTAMLPAIGQDVKIYTYMYVREDILDLYGFLTRDDLAVFKLLIGVSGIGPKGALGILSVLSADDLRFAVLSGDAKTISKAPGIGSKTAQKLVIELKDKLKLVDAFEQKLEHNKEVSYGAEDTRGEAVQALTALGYSGADAMRAVRQVQIGESMTVEELLKASLKIISSF